MSTGYTFDATTLVAKMYKIWLITFVGLESCILFNHLWAGVVDMVATSFRCFLRTVRCAVLVYGMAVLACNSSFPCSLRRVRGVMGS